MAEAFFNTLGHQITDAFNPSSSTYIPNVINNEINTVGNQFQQGVTGTVNTLGGAFDNVIHTVGGAAGDLIHTVGGAAGDLAGSLSSSLMMPLMVLGGLGLAFVLLKK